MLQTHVAHRFKQMLVIAMTLVLFIPIAVYTASIAKGTSSDILHQCQQVWAHRGLTTHETENSLSAFDAAFKQGARGIELDLFFYSDQNRFVVTHDKIDVYTPELLTLEQVFKTFGQDKYYWLDFKNLYQLDSKERKLALARLETLSSKLVPKSRFVVESIDVHALKTFTEGDFITSYWVTLTNDFSTFSYFIHTFKIKIKYLLGQFTAVSTDLDNYSDRFQFQLSSIPTLLFTVNEQAKVGQLFERDNVRVILSDLPIYQSTQGCTDDKDQRS